MLAAPAHITNAKPAVPGDASASQPGGANGGASADGFNGALAALMSQLGPATPTTTQPTTSPPASDRAASAAGASARSKSFAPTVKDAQSGSNEPQTQPASASSSNSPTDDVAAAQPAGGPADASDASQAPASPTPGQAASSADVAGQAPLDPRLIQFVAKSATSPSSGAPIAATATDEPAVQDPATAATQAAIQDATQAAATASSADPSVGAADANAQVAPPTTLLTTLVAPGQAPPGGAAPASAGAAPPKSAKAAQVLALVSAATKSVADAATPASEVIKAAVGASDGDDTPVADATDAQADTVFALSHDDNQTAADAQAPTPGSGASDAQIPQPSTLAAPLAAGTAAPPTAAAMASSHGAEITAQLAAQISSRASAPRTAFDFALDPQGLGRVDVTLKIDPQGQLSAVLSFDNPSAAAEAKSRAADLHQALQQAGFDVGQSGLSFTSSGGQGQGAAWQTAAQASYPQAPIPSDSVAESISPTSRLGVSAAGGLDITI